MDLFSAVPPARLETAGDVDRLEGDVDAEAQSSGAEPEDAPGFAPGDTPDDAAGESGASGAGTV